MTEIPIAPDVFRGLVALFAFAAMVMVVFGLLLPSRGETPDWLRDTQERLGMAGLNSGLFLLFAILWFVLFFILFAGLVWLLWTTFFLDYPKEKVAQWDFGFHIAQVAAFAAVFGAVVALPVTLHRLNLTARQTKAAEETAEQTQLARFDRRLENALRGLSASSRKIGIGRNVKTENGASTLQWLNKGETQIPDKAEAGEWSNLEFDEPNLEDRISALDELVNLAHEKPSEASRIGERIQVFVRLNTPLGSSLDSARHKIDDLIAESPLDEEQALYHLGFSPDDIGDHATRDWARRLSMRTDIQYGLSKLGDPIWRSARVGVAGMARLVQSGDASPPFSVLLEGCNLQGARLQAKEYRFSSFFGSRLDGLEARACQYFRSKWEDVTMTGGGFSACDFRLSELGGRFRYVEFTECDFAGANLSGGEFRCVQFRGGRFDVERMDNCLFRDVDFIGFHFGQVPNGFTRFDHVLFDRCSFDRFRSSLHNSKRRFIKCAFRNCDLSKEHLHPGSLDGFFGDAGTKLPEGWEPDSELWPKHWPKRKLSANLFFNDAFTHAWRKWRQDPNAFDPSAY